MKKQWLITLLILLMILGCKDTMTENSKTSKPVNSKNIMHEVGDIKYLVSLPRVPETITWSTAPQSGNRDSTLTARMKFSDTDYQFILDNSNKFEVKNNEFVGQEFFDEWIKGVLPSATRVEKQDQYMVLHGIYALEPNLFTQAKSSPYIHGRVIPLGNNYLVLSLYTM